MRGYMGWNVNQTTSFLTWHHKSSIRITGLLAEQCKTSSGQNRAEPFHTESCRECALVSIAAHFLLPTQGTYSPPPQIPWHQVTPPLGCPCNRSSAIKSGHDTFWTRWKEAIFYPCSRVIGLYKLLTCFYTALRIWWQLNQAATSAKHIVLRRSPFHFELLMRN